MTTYTIRQDAPAGWGQIVATASDNGAGAIESLKWVGGVANPGSREYIDSFDHGRLLQSAVSFDNLGEACNPTEGGAANDIYMGQKSSSRLPAVSAAGNILTTVNKMAYWNPVNGVHCSNVLLQKTVTLGFGGAWNAVEHSLNFMLPGNEVHGLAVFEFLTGYMPVEFSRFETLNLDTGATAPLDPGPGEQSQPVVFSTADGAFAMAVYSPGGTPGGGYGRWLRPEGATCVKWNAVARVTNPAPGGDYGFKVRSAVGSRADAIQTLRNLYRNVPA